MLLLEAIYFFLPAGFGNMAPVLFKWVPFLNKPVCSKLFGKNKTWRGMLFFVLLSLFVISIQRLIGFDLSFFSYSSENFLLVGLLMGFGAFLGDLIESFFKRKLKIKPGKDLFFWDQVDFVIGGLIFVAFYKDIGLVVNLLVLVSYFVLHLIIKNIGYWLKIDKRS